LLQADFAAARRRARPADGARACGGGRQRTASSWPLTRMKSTGRRSPCPRSS